MDFWTTGMRFTNDSFTFPHLGLVPDSFCSEILPFLVQSGPSFWVVCDFLFWDQSCDCSKELKNLLEFNLFDPLFNKLTEGKPMFFWLLFMLDRHSWDGEAFTILWNDFPCRNTQNPVLVRASLRRELCNSSPFRLWAWSSATRRCFCFLFFFPDDLLSGFGVQHNPIVWRYVFGAFRSFVGLYDSNSVPVMPFRYWPAIRCHAFLRRLAFDSGWLFFGVGTTSGCEVLEQLLMSVVLFETWQSELWLERNGPFLRNCTFLWLFSSWFRGSISALSGKTNSPGKVSTFFDLDRKTAMLNMIIYSFYFANKVFAFPAVTRLNMVPQKETFIWCWG